MATALRAERRPAITIAWIAFWLMVVGGINWGLVGVFDFDLVAAIFGDGSAAARVVYTLVGLSALYCAFTLPRLRRYSGSSAQTA
jgi:uncharacterized protein